MPSRLEHGICVCLCVYLCMFVCVGVCVWCIRSSFIFTSKVFGHEIIIEQYNYNISLYGDTDLPDHRGVCWFFFCYYILLHKSTVIVHGGLTHLLCTYRNVGAKPCSVRSEGVKRSCGLNKTSGVEGGSEFSIMGQKICEKNVLHLFLKIV